MSCSRQGDKFLSGDLSKEQVESDSTRSKMLYNPKSSTRNFRTVRVFFEIKEETSQNCQRLLKVAKRSRNISRFIGLRKGSGHHALLYLLPFFFLSKFNSLCAETWWDGENVLERLPLGFGLKRADEVLRHGEFRLMWDCEKCGKSS